MTDKKKEKDHADFQDKYRRSSNFGREEKDDNLKVKGDGTLKTGEEKDGLTEEEKEDIKDATDSFGEENEEEK
ncbi:hypothetical protein RM553_03165 [Zunongwangia sp. F363]|uniref:Uncharacterized protein n=1 Tax=Autumnicola tepida TaxID=3075595 RepID=A0ABU3C662_9FLAO|nr:hypothetical protein [Zunongwangia sp. F363]MDT0641824.1 hypothetical protein [Zunongwangia sp. F363]